VRGCCTPAVVKIVHFRPGLLWTCSCFLTELHLKVWSVLWCVNRETLNFRCVWAWWRLYIFEALAITKNQTHINKNQLGEAQRTGGSRGSAA
jgi:hypothetical protein